MPDYLEQIPFTGMISACGCTIEKDGKRLFNKEMTTEEAWHSVEVLRKYGMIPVMEGADWMYYDKDEYNTDINWYADLITKALGVSGVLLRGMNTTFILIRSVLRSCREVILRRPVRSLRTIMSLLAM